MKKSKSQIKEDAEISRLRRRCGLPQIKLGNRNCLCCNEKFYSKDVANEKLCEKCRVRLANYGG